MGKSEGGRGTLRYALRTSLLWWEKEKMVLAFVLGSSNLQ
jgi:hypothetical protein